ncbi:MAG: inactive serine/threonine-protein kinase VRK3, partial [Candidatus Binataceae bacterium]
MIICPQCGEEAADGAKFCDRCGQGLADNVARRPAPLITPLAAGVELKHDYRIVALVSQSSRENRYRAERAAAPDGGFFQLREQLGPARGAIAADAPTEQPAAAAVQVEADPAGPRAKTADLRGRSLGANGRAVAELSTIAEPVPAALIADDRAAASEDDSIVELSDAITSAEAAPPAAAASNRVEDFKPVAATAQDPTQEDTEDLGDTFGRVRALSLTLNHPAIYRAEDGFAQAGRVYLAYRDEPLTPLAQRPGGPRMTENEALSVAIQLCQAVAFIHRRGLRVNDLCPATIAFDGDKRVKLLGLDYVSNDDELQSEPIFNDGYTAPEIYRGKKADKRADIFAIAAVLYT